jgi:hypothetical protein
MEIYWICYFDSFYLDGGGYNLTRGGDGSNGTEVSEETKKKISDSKIGEKNPNWRKSPSEETRQKQRDAMSGDKSYWFDKHLPEETRQKISDTLKGTKMPEETKKKISESTKGEKNHNFRKPISNEQKGKMDKGKELRKNSMTEYEYRLSLSLQSSSLSLENVLEVKRMLSDEMGNSDIAKHFGVSTHIIWDIKKGNTWAWLTSESKEEGKNERFV